MRELRTLALVALLLASAPVAAQSNVQARFDSMSYRSVESAEAPAGNYRNPILPGFHPDPSIVRVGEDFYLVTSTFGWFPGLPVFHSRDLVNWRLIGHAIDRPGMVDFSAIQLVWDGLYAPAISWHEGTFYILNTCVRCGGNFYVTATNPAGPWSGPVWLGFEGIDPSLFVDDDGRGWVVNNGAPAVPERYEGHRAIWIQEFDLARGQLIGPRSVLIDGGVHPEDKPIWAEGPHIYKHDGWYYLSVAEGGTERNHSQTIYRSHNVTGPYTPGPVNPILTQRDLPSERPGRVEATGHAELVRLDDGSWWSSFLATRPFAGQETLLGRETFLLPVQWIDGWPLILEAGTPVPWELPKPNLPADRAVDWSRWTDGFDGDALSGEWLTMFGPPDTGWAALAEGRLELQPGTVAAGGKGQPHAVMRRMRHPEARWTTRLSFTPRRDGDFAGLLAFASPDHFIELGIADEGNGPEMVLRQRKSAEQGERGALLFRHPLDMVPDEVELMLEIRHGRAEACWRPAGEEHWRTLGVDVDVSDMASIHAALFTGVTVGPYAVTGP